MKKLRLLATLFITLVVSISIALVACGGDEDIKNTPHAISDTSDDFGMKSAYAFTAFSDSIQNGNIYRDGKVADVGEGYQVNVEKNTEITLTAIEKPDCIFLGWYDERMDAENLKNGKLLSKEYTHTFIVKGVTQVYARFVKRPIEPQKTIELDGTDAGFINDAIMIIDGVTIRKTIINQNCDNPPDIQKVKVYLVEEMQRQLLDDTQYQVELNGYDSGATQGIYRITFTYNENSNLHATFVVEVK